MGSRRPARGLPQARRWPGGGATELLVAGPLICTDDVRVCWLGHTDLRFVVSVALTCTGRVAGWVLGGVWGQGSERRECCRSEG
jgi:hypothetical protein